MITADTLNMSREEFNNMVQDELLDFFNQNKHFAWKLSEIQTVEPLKWFNSQVILANLNILVKRNQVKKIIKTYYGISEGSYKYISPRKTKKLNTEQQNEEIRHLDFIRQNKKF